MNSRIFKTNKTNYSSKHNNTSYNTSSDVNQLKIFNRLKMSFNRLIIAINRLIAIKTFNPLID